MGTRNFLGAFVVAVALFAVFPFVLGKYQQVGEFRVALAEREQLVVDRQAALDNVTKELDKYRTRLMGDSADKFAAIVPSDRSTAELISSFDAIAQESGITLGQVSFSEERQRPGATTSAVGISLQATGSYVAFLNFLSAVEESVRLMDIQSLQVGGGQDSQVLQFDVTLRAYFL